MREGCTNATRFPQANMDGALRKTLEPSFDHEGLNPRILRSLRSASEPGVEAVDHVLDRAQSDLGDGV